MSAIESLDVANTILAQLGGTRFVAMTGARYFSVTQNSLQFQLPGGPNFTRDGINHVKIVLDASDTYTVTFGKIRGVKYKIVSEHSGVYAEDLQRLFRYTTGLETRL